MSRTTAYIALGSNLGDRQRFIDDALKMLRKSPGIDVVAATAPADTAPLGGVNQLRYLNAVAELQTNLSAKNLHKRLIEIEDALGRKRSKKWSSRTIDLDLLLFGGDVINTDKLIVPHPQMHLRSFVLNGLCRLNPNLLHPVLNETVSVLAGRLNGCDYVPPTDRPQLISIAGNIGAGKTTLAKKLAAVLSCRAIFEAYDTNPFLPKVYAGDKALALDSQLYFLASRVEQLNPSALDKNQLVITDYVFDKELIYANLLLSKEQLGLYLKIHSQLSSGVAVPALLIHLADSPEKCLQRIHRRNRPYEQRIQPDFLETIDAGYKKLVAGWESSPVITLTDFDCLNQKDVDRLAVQIGYYLNLPQADKTVKRL
ncbi:MAG: 2-amino-4-hydroxy-6-hydroxymethyldihydropteridine diphosphokinase [Sedimentisphaerales bacterium]|jgi:2-amino-4-hydroxy-6-hydroxymethyldihydropteridine diphosphokinase